MKDEIKEKQLKEVLYGLDYIGNKIKNDDGKLELGVNNCKILLDYITNLQDRTKELEQINEEHRRINGELRNGYCEIKEKCNKGECDCTNEEYESMAQANMKLRLLLDDYKTRIDKAIRLIKEAKKEFKKEFTNGKGEK